MIVLDEIRRTAEHDPDRIALVFGDYAITYREVFERVEFIREALRMGSGHLVFVHINSSPSGFVSALLAALASGCRVFPVPPSMSTPAVDRLLKIMDPHVIIKDLYTIDFRGVTPASAIGEPMLLHLTSGSYGAQKIVLRSIENLDDEAMAVVKHLGLRKGHNVLATTPLSHSFGDGIWRATLVAGATLCVADDPDFHRRMRQIRRMAAVADYMFGVPYIYSALARFGQSIGLPKMARCFAGGEPLAAYTAQRWEQANGIRLQQEYGLSEGGITTIAKPDESSASIGSPLPGVKLVVEESGELIVYRPHAPNQYLIEGSGQTFRPDGGIATGDLVDLVHGEYRFRGRSKAIIVVAGLKVTPTEIEDAIRRHPLVEDVAVVGVKDPLTGERPVAYIVPKEGHELDTRILRERLKGELDSYKVPQVMTVVDRLPRTESGKVNRNAL